ncbi:DUF1240 domain-containing protein [Xenorhabdus sp. Reich]|uniref:DUF1240 domain-containing protein n=1 Tax=Xenorhabdus littoralis TaxID=2582835 RepID=A0ABU4SRV7_9GAMM|nr:DUF1240 domain-containing protein [Xenorhabdus sp. Reich]MDX8001250.1 DUF1240 domain-containing protein [Xenorhabdus sp. Reich]
MENNNKNIIVIGSFSLVLAMVFCNVFIFNDIISILNRSNEINFSWKSIAIISGSPLFIYMFSCAFYYSISSKTMKLNNKLIKILTIIFFVFFLFSFPFSWYLDSKFKAEGYIVCEQMSVVSLNKYVKYPEMCR